MDQDRFWILLSKKFALEASVSELQELENFIVENPFCIDDMNALERIWQYQKVSPSAIADKAFEKHIFKKEQAELNTGKTIPIKRRWLKFSLGIAASAFLLLLTFVVFKKNIPEPLTAQKVPNDLQTVQAEGISSITLKDGSTVRLNKGSKISYAKGFGDNNRELTLVGEAFFDVVKKNGQPFIIHTNTITIRVLGTAFNVKAYPEDKKTETSLMRGRIEVTLNTEPNNKIVLMPTEKLVVDNAYQPIAGASEEDRPAKINLRNLATINKIQYYPADSTVVETAWVENKLVFRDESFEDLAIRLERFYNVQIEFADSRLLSKRLTGIFEKETINEALDALSITIPFRFIKKGNNYILKN